MYKHYINNKLLIIVIIITWLWLGNQSPTFIYLFAYYLII